MTELTRIAFVASPLQRAVFLKSRYNEGAEIIGHRGMPGNMSFDHSILADYRFLAQFREMLVGRKVEVFLPHSLCSLYYFCVAHPNVVRISYIDEGRLTRRHLYDGSNKLPLPGWRLLGYQLARYIPDPICGQAYRALGRTLRRAIRLYSQQAENFPYRTIDMTHKTGVLLSHIVADGAEYVDITKGVDLEKDLSGACLFVHPNDIATDHQIHSICSRIESAKGVIRPHPMFSRHPERLEKLKMHLGWDIVTISNVHETTVELYARGIRTFISPVSSIIETVRANPDFFSDLELVTL